MPLRKGNLSRVLLTNLLCQQTRISRKRKPEKVYSCRLSLLTCNQDGDSDSSALSAAVETGRVGNMIIVGNLKCHCGN